MNTDSELIEDLHPLIDREASLVANHIDLTGVATIDEAQFRLREYFRTEGASVAVTVEVSGVITGVVTRMRLQEYEGTAGGDPRGSQTVTSMGSGERIQLPGQSRYRLLEFACPIGDTKAYRIQYEERDLPHCPEHPDLGPMVLAG